jgi:hypothetical protein
MGCTKQNPSSCADHLDGLKLLSDAAVADARVNLDPRDPYGTYAPLGAVERLKYTARALDRGARGPALRAAAELFALCAKPDGKATPRAAAWACSVQLLQCNREINSVFINQVVLELAWASKLGAANACLDSVTRASRAP